MLTTFFHIMSSLRVGETVPFLLCFLGVDRDIFALLKLLYMNTVEIIINLLLLIVPPYKLKL